MLVKVESIVWVIITVIIKNLLKDSLILKQYCLVIANHEIYLIFLKEVLIRLHDPAIGTAMRSKADPTTIQGKLKERDWTFDQRKDLICTALTVSHSYLPRGFLELI